MRSRCTKFAVMFEPYDPKSPKPRLRGDVAGEFIIGNAPKESLSERLEEAKRFIKGVEAAAKSFDECKIPADAKTKIKSEALDLAVKLMMEIGAHAIREIDQLGDEKHISSIAKSIKGNTGLIPPEVLETALPGIKDGVFTKIYSRLGFTDFERIEMLNDVLIASITWHDVSLQKFISELLFEVENIPAFIRLGGLQGEFTARIKVDYFTAWG